MDRETIHVCNDLLDVVEELTKLVRELNPGAQNQLAFIDFMIARASRTLNEAGERT